METISFKLSVFEGPLDLLLSLITKHKLDIYDIPITKLLEQYLEYISAAKKMDMELSSEFLEMAARLVQIKSAMLLPTDDEAEVLKQELTGELIEYHLCKVASSRLGSGYRGNVFFVRNPMEIEMDMTYTKVHKTSELFIAYSNINVKQHRRALPNAERFSDIVDRPVVSVTGKIINLMKSLIKKKSISFRSIFYKEKFERSEKVATFLALLELIRSGRVKIDQNDNITLIKKERGAL